MAKIILIETSTALCSVALAEDGVCTHYKASPEPRAHAAMTAPFVKDILDEAGLKVSDCDAVCVSKGPGSYTGLRVGSSTAKGLCFGAGIPLIAVGTLEVLAAQALLHLKADPAAEIAENLSERPRSVLRSNPAAGPLSAIVPMIDARRMEVYTAVFSPEGKQLTPTVSSVITPESFAEELAVGPVLFVGDGAAKCRSVLTSPNAIFPDSQASGSDAFTGCPKASSMAALAEAAFRSGRFEDTAYFEPFYLKDFVAVLPKNKIF